MPERCATKLDWRDPLIAFSGLRDEAFSILLHGGGAEERGRRSLLFAFPEQTLVDEHGSGALEILQAGGPGGSGAFGWAGLFAYDFAASLERLPEAAQPRGFPAVAMGWYRAALEFDHETRTIAILGERKAGQALAERLGAHAAQPLDFQPAPLAPLWPEARYLDAVERARAYVRAGDVFQVNLSHPFEAAPRGADAPFAVFERLAQSSPAAFAGYLRLDADHCVVTNSPERFLRADADGAVEARPIKGTRPRGATAAADAALAAELAASVKDRAENLMIVDLMRNDLARACAAGSVKAHPLFQVERFANVHHLVSTVTGRLAPGRTVYDLIRGAFPPGSITGAPKVRAMEIIAELEGEPRGAYCGSMGWIGADGSADLNVMIRTLAFFRDASGWRAQARSGGAITIDSDPAEELEETRAKIAALAAAISGAGSP